MVFTAPLLGGCCRLFDAIIVFVVVVVGCWAAAAAGGGAAKQAKNWPTCQTYTDLFYLSGGIQGWCSCLSVGRERLKVAQREPFVEPTEVGQQLRRKEVLVARHADDELGQVAHLRGKQILI